MRHDLPVPARTRWQPLRAGLVDLFYYDVEEFHFHDGRLLLRGNNGTGKSKVLALLLPFLLDGDLSPHRVEPDADPKKRMEWNLLLGGEHPHPERLGYTWLEFGRLTEDGRAEFRTLGCGLKAVSGRGIARHWYVLTDQRVGTELALVDATRTALSRERLADAVAGRGVVYDRAKDYRRAVDEALFGLGEQRYGALVDLLVHLRQPQLSKRPSEKALSEALTEALPPLDQAVVADVAEAFRSLESDRDELTAMTEADGSARAFLGHYRSYAAVAARRRAELPRRAEGRHRSARDELAAAEEAHRTADQAAEVAQARLDELEHETGRLRARDQDLRTGPEMRTAAELDRLAAESTRRADEAGAATRARGIAESAAARHQERRDAAAARRESATGELAGVREQARDGAAQARLSTAHAEVDTGLDTGLDSDAGPARAREAADRGVGRQERAIRHVESLLGADDEARGALRAVRETVDRLAGAAAELAEQREATSSDVERHGTELVSATRTYLDGVTELTVPEPDAVLAALELWASTLDGPQPARAAVEDAGRDATTALARTEAALEQQVADVDRRAAEIRTEITRLEAGEHGAPPAPHTRDPDARTGRPGAPLWQLVDFADDRAELDDAARAGLEAALEASGVLDAWLSPDGELRGPDGDVLVSPRSDPAGPGPGSTLDAALCPAVDRDDAAAAVPDTAVSAVLRAIGLGDPAGGGRAGGDPAAAERNTWVSTTGRFRIGVLTGGWTKPAAQYVGRGAREAARRARLGELRAAATAVEAERSELDDARARLAARRATLRGELSELPADTVLCEAHAALGALAAQQARLVAERAEADTAAAAAARRAQDTAAELADGAADVDLPADAAGLDSVRSALAGYRIVLAGLWPAARAAADALRHESETAEELAAAQASAAEAADRDEVARHAARTAAEAFQARRETVGAAVEELQRRLREVADGLSAAERNRRDRAGEKERAVADRGRAEGRREAATTAVSETATERADAAESLRRFTGTGLIAVALPELDVPPADADTGWAPEPAVRLARQIDQELADTVADDPAWDRQQRRVTDELKTLADTLSRHGNTASAQLLEDGIVVQVVFRGRPATVPELTAALGDEVTERQRLLDEREREILENHLVNEVASTLQELISDAERQVATMNGELSERPTSTGMALRLEWRPREDGPAGLAEARRRLLRQSADAWSAEDRSAVGSFLQDRIAEVRARDESGTWLDHLTTALDYRSWHRFAIARHQNGQWRSATGPASGGERVLAASVPLFAAASAHYASAGNPHAPRLVTLDEAFAGVDDNARAKYLGLLAAFDLDVVMTSEREWGCYPEVPGLAIAQLARADGVPAVLVTNWRWDGEQRRPMPRPVSLPDAPPPTAAVAAAGTATTASLFDDL